MRVCLISNQQSEHIQRLSNYLESMNHEVHLISVRGQGLKLENVVLHHLNAKPIFWPLQIKNLVKYINPDIVDGHFASVYGFLAALSGFHPLVVTVWGSDIFVKPWQNPLWKFTTKYALDKADVINCLFQESIAKPALLRLNVDIRKVRTSLLGVDTEVFKPRSFDINLAIEIGVTPDVPLVINVRGFAPVYDFKTYFQAIPLVLEKVPEAKFIALYKKGERELGEQLAKELGIAKNILLLEWLPHSKMPRLLSLANIYVSTAISDGASNALLEAMACEITPVVTDIPANRYWVYEGINGMLFPPGNSRKLADCIVNLTCDKKYSSRLSHRSRQLVQEKAEQKEKMRNIESAYYELIGVKTSPKGKLL